VVVLDGMCGVVRAVVVGPFLMLAVCKRGFVGGAGGGVLGGTMSSVDMGLVASVPSSLMGRAIKDRCTRTRRPCAPRRARP
jgi:hypothetical protein